MSQDAQPAAATPLGVAADVLDDGEVVLLALRPSPWFLLLTSWQVLLVAAIVTAMSYVAVGVFEMQASFPPSGMALICLVASLLRVGIALIQWIGRLYVLTNRRVLHLRGVSQPVVFERRLKDIVLVEPTAGRGERSLGLGGLTFHTAVGPAWEVAWTHLAQPQDVLEAVDEALRKVR